jgi:hypothetical protein
MNKAVGSTSIRCDYINEALARLHAKNPINDRWIRRARRAIC